MVICKPTRYSDTVVYALSIVDDDVPSTHNVTPQNIP